jgi:hypothetical protein
MTLYIDADDTYLLGDASYSSNVLSSNVDLNTFHNVFENFVVKSGWRVRYIASKEKLFAVFETALALSLCSLGAKDDSIHTRVLTYVSTGSAAPFNLYSDLGNVATSYSTVSTTNRVMRAGNILSGVNNLNTCVRGFLHAANGYTRSDYKYLGVSDGNRLGLIFSHIHNAGTLPIARNLFWFAYFGLLDSPNTSVLGSDIVNHYIWLGSAFSNGTPHSSGRYDLVADPSGQYIICGKVYSPSGDELLIRQNLDSFYPYDEDSRWATNFVVYDSVGNILGTAKHLKIANGVYPPLKPVKLANYTESGNNTWIPVGILGGKTILMRCYSSEVFNEDVTEVPLVDVFTMQFCAIDMTSYYSF